MSVLGAPLSTHRAKLIGKAFGVLCAAAMTVGMVWAIFVMKPEQAQLCWLITLGFAAVTAVLGVVWWRDRSLVITAYERGIAWTRASVNQAVAFDDVAAVREWRVNGKPVCFIIGLHTGRELRVPSNVTDREALLEHLTGRRAPASVPTAVATFKR